MKITKILVFGNPLVKKDSLPLKLIRPLQKKFPNLEFKEFDSIEEIQNEGRILYIIDSVEDIKEVTIITDIDLLNTHSIYSVHDFDLANSLRLLKKLKMIDKVIIFGIPMFINKKKVLIELVENIKSILILGND